MKDQDKVLELFNGENDQNLPILMAGSKITEEYYDKLIQLFEDLNQYSDYALSTFQADMTRTDGYRIRFYHNYESHNPFDYMLAWVDSGSSYPGIGCHGINGCGPFFHAEKYLYIKATELALLFDIAYHGDWKEIIEYGLDTKYTREQIQELVNPLKKIWDDYYYGYEYGRIGKGCYHKRSELE